MNKHWRFTIINNYSGITIKIYIEFAENFVVQDREDKNMEHERHKTDEEVEKTRWMSI